METYLGIDVGSLTIKFVLIDQNVNVLYHSYQRTEGKLIEALKKELYNLKEKIIKKNPEIEIRGVATTGSARYLAGIIVGADIIKNEITAHAKGVVYFVPEARTVIEIGGQDSKIIILENGMVVDFGLNYLCSAGTGAFLDAQAFRLGIPVEEFGRLALKSKKPTVISSRCSVFAESDMIHKQQVGQKIEDIVAGLCQGLARNYLSGVAKGKKIFPPIVFLGGVSQNIGMRWAFEEVLGQEIIVPKYNTVMGAFGAALLAKENSCQKTKFRGFGISEKEISCSSFQCQGCSNRCEVIEALVDGKIVARWQDRCGKWSGMAIDNKSEEI